MKKTNPDLIPWHKQSKCIKTVYHMYLWCMRDVHIHKYFMRRYRRRFRHPCFYVILVVSRSVFFLSVEINAVYVYSTFLYLVYTQCLLKVNLIQMSMVLNKTHLNTLGFPLQVNVCLKRMINGRITKYM